MADQPTDQQLQDLKAKYITLISGGAARVVFDGNSGDRVEFFAADSDKLLAYIRIYDPMFMVDTGGGLNRVSRPVRFVF